MLRISGQGGFTLIEMAIVMIISGLLVTGGLSAYDLYARDHRIRVTYERLDKFKIAMDAFYKAQGRFPCPSRPKVSMDSPQSGKEDCPQISINNYDSSTGLAVGAGRATSYDGLLADKVFIGSIPYKTLQLGFKDLDPNDGSMRDDGDSTSSSSVDVSRENTLDGWNRQMIYAVPKALTSKGTFDTNRGAIAVTTENGYDLARLPGTALWAAYSAGDDGLGAYDTDGDLYRTSAACNSSTISPKMGERNCQAYKVPVLTFISGLRSMVPGNNYFDDIVYFSASKYFSPWTWAQNDAVHYSAADGSPVAGTGSVSTRDIVNTNIGNVGIGNGSNIPNFPQQKLEVVGNIKAKDVYISRVYDYLHKAGQYATISPHGFMTNIDICPSTTDGTGIYLISGFANATMSCSVSVALPIVSASSCPTGQYAIGITSGGAFICQ